VHRYDNSRLVQADDFCCFGSVQPAAAPNRNQGYIDVAQSLYLGLTGHPAQVAQMCNGYFLIVENIQNITKFIFGTLFPIGFYCGDENTANFVFTRSFDDPLFGFDSRIKIMTRHIVADRDDITA